MIMTSWPRNLQLQFARGRGRRERTWLRTELQHDAGSPRGARRLTGQPDALCSSRREKDGTHQAHATAPSLRRDRSFLPAAAQEDAESRVDSDAWAAQRWEARETRILAGEPGSRPSLISIALFSIPGPAQGKRARLGDPRRRRLPGVSCREPSAATGRGCRTRRQLGPALGGSAGSSVQPFAHHRCRQTPRNASLPPGSLETRCREAKAGVFI